MNRLKFRVWDKKLKNFLVNGEFFLGLDNELYEYVYGEPEFISIEAVYNPNEEYFVIQQFTGLYDKNKKEIYEGDILKRTWWNGDPHATLITNIKVVEYDPYKGYRFIENESPIGWLWEIIGNIFENPDLLK